MSVNDQLCAPTLINLDDASGLLVATNVVSAVNIASFFDAASIDLICVNLLDCCAKFRSSALVTGIWTSFNINFSFIFPEEIEFSALFFSCIFNSKLMALRIFKSIFVATLFLSNASPGFTFEFSRTGSLKKFILMPCVLANCIKLSSLGSSPCNINLLPPSNTLSSPTTLAIP